MTDAKLQTLIEQAFEDRAEIDPQTTGDVRDAVETALDLLDSGKARVAEKIPGATGPNSWKVNQWLKKAVLLSFRLNDNRHHRGRARRGDLVGQGPVEIRGLGREPIPRGGVARRARRDRAPLGLRRAATSS